MTMWARTPETQAGGETSLGRGRAPGGLREGQGLGTAHKATHTLLTFLGVFCFISE